MSTTPTGSDSNLAQDWRQIGISRGLQSNHQYFFKSQESLATVIDTVSDNEENDDEGGDDDFNTKTMDTNSNTAEPKDKCAQEKKSDEDNQDARPKQDEKEKVTATKHTFV